MSLVPGYLGESNVSLLLSNLSKNISKSEILSLRDHLPGSFSSRTLSPDSVLKPLQDSTRTGILWPWLHFLTSLDFSILFKDSSVSLPSCLWDCSRLKLPFLTLGLFIGLMSTTSKLWCDCISILLTISVYLLVNNPTKAPRWALRQLWRLENSHIILSSRADYVYPSLDCLFACCLYLEENRNFEKEQKIVFYMDQLQDDHIYIDKLTTFKLMLLH